MVSRKSRISRLWSLLCGAPFVQPGLQCHSGGRPRPGPGQRRGAGLPWRIRGDRQDCHHAGNPAQAGYLSPRRRDGLVRRRHRQFEHSGLRHLRCDYCRCTRFSFAVAGFRDYGDAFVYHLLSPMNPAKPAWLAGVGALTAGGGGDIPEAQYDAIVSAASGLPFGPACGWRADPNVTHVLVVTTDAPFHVPPAPWVNDATTTLAALNAQGIRVIGLPAPGAGGELARAGCGHWRQHPASELQWRQYRGWEPSQACRTCRSRCR